MEAYDLGLITGLVGGGVQVTVHTSALPVNTKGTEPPQCRVIESYAGVFGVDPAPLRMFRFLRGTMRALWSARVMGHRLVHLHFFSIGMLEVFNLYMSRLFGMHTVVTIHDVDVLGGSESSRLLRHSAYRLTDCLIVHNRASEVALRKSGAPRGANITVIPMGHLASTTPTLVPRDDACGLLGLTPSDEIILFFGQIKPTKGLEVLIDAMPEVLRRRPRARLVIAGRPWRTAFAPYAERIAARGIADRCTTAIRFIPTEELSTFLSAANLLVLPYRKIYQSAIVLMAMAAERAIVVSDLEAMREVVDDGETGWMFHRDDPAALATTICDALSDATERTRRVKNAASWVRTNADWITLGRQTVTAYDQIISGKSGRCRPSWSGLRGEWGR